jgi:hypothetical protein
VNKLSRVPLDLAEADRLAPWWFRFELAGEAFGGDTPRDTAKVAFFREWLERCDGQATAILELGSHEGSHSLQLAALPGVERVLGLEGRADNLARARYDPDPHATREGEPEGLLRQARQRVLASGVQQPR